MATYLVTGGCGFIGSHLADALLAAGHAVRILDDLSTGKLANKPEKAALIRGDVADEETVAEAMRGVEGCFHLAAVASVERCREDWIGSHRVNLTGTIVVFDAARRANPARPLPVVYASSAAVYGEPARLPLTEDDATRPLSAYGADKSGCEMHAAVAGRMFGVPAVGLRFFNVFGSRQDPSSPYSGVISIFLDRIARGLTLTIHGDGEQTRDFIHVGDVVRAMQAAMTRAAPEATVLNVCTGRPTSVRALAETIADIAGVRLRVECAPARPGDIRASVGNPSRAQHLLGFAAETTLRGGVTQLVKASTAVS